MPQMERPAHESTGRGIEKPCVDAGFDLNPSTPVPLVESGRPETHQGDLRCLPPALAPLVAERRWVVWKWELKNAKGKWTKPPYQALSTSSLAANNRPNTWA